MSSADLDAEKIKREYAYINTVEEVASFHIWGVSEGQHCIMATLRIAGQDTATVLAKAKALAVEQEFAFATFQVEPNLSP